MSGTERSDFDRIKKLKFWARLISRNSSAVDINDDRLEMGSENTAERRVSENSNETNFWALKLLGKNLLEKIKNTVFNKQRICILLHYFFQHEYRCYLFFRPIPELL